MKNKVIKKILLFFVSIFFIYLSLFICEQFLKYHPIETNHLYLDFANTGIDNVYTIDSQLIYSVNDSFNYRNPLRPKDSNKINVAFVGDSVTWSFGAKDDSSYPESFEKIFNQKYYHQKILVNNFGIPGYNFDQEYLQIRKKIIPEYHPDLIIWNLNVNDVFGSNYSCLFTQKDSQWYQISARRNLYYWYGALKTYRSPLLTKSKLFSLFWYQFTNQVSPIIMKNNFTFGCTTFKYTPLVQKQMINKLDYFLKRLKEELQIKNIKLIVTLTPYQQIYDNQENFEKISPDYFALKEYLLSNKFINFQNFNELVLKTEVSTNPADEYFLDSANDVGEKGWRHPNQKMYNLMAFILAEYVKNNKLF